MAQALAGANVGVWHYDVATGMATWDEVAEVLNGGQRPGASDPFAMVAEADRARLIQSLGDCVRKGVSHNVEFRSHRPNGEMRWLQAFAHPLGSGSAPDTLTGIIFDITERKAAEAAMRESERQLRSIIASLPGVAYRCGLEPPWPLSFISENVEALTGYTVAEFVNGDVHWNAVTLAEDRPLVDDAVGRAIAERQRFNIDYRIVHRSGEVRWVHERGGAAYDEHGTPLFLEGFIGDVHEHKLAQAKLHAAEERYRLISLAAMDMVWELDFATGELSMSDAFGAFLGYSTEDVVLDHDWWINRIHPDDRAHVTGEIYRFITGSATQYTCEHRIQRADGSYAYVYACGIIVRDEAGTPTRMVACLQDLTERKLADAALRESEAINRSIVEASTDCVVLLDRDGRVEFLNKATTRFMTPEDVASAYGQPWQSLWPEAVRPRIREAIETALAGGIGRYSNATAAARDDESSWWDVIVSPVIGADGVVTKLVAISRDVTQTKQAEEELLRAATRDSLTGLANRSFFQQALADAVGRAAKGRGRMGLMLLDLDEFKQVNDTLGHDAGDALLKALADRLVESCPDATLVARLGGDEFAVMFEDLDDRPLSERAADILKILRAPVIHAGRVLDCNVTIGAAICPEHGKTPDDLLKSADIALYAAKSSRRGGFIIFRPEHRADMQERLSMISCARMAIRHDRIVPFYQPKVELDGGGLHGFEALLRWRHDRQGIQLPATIAAAFDDLDLATAISDTILDAVVLDMRRWLDSGIEFGHVAVNAAAPEFRRDDFAEGILERLERAGVPPSRLQLEVTETVFLGRGADYVSRALKLLSGAGISIALDDFGTGYASLRHLRQFPVHVIKIDQSFVRNMDTDADDAAIIEAVLNLGRSLKIEVVAEGIETQRQEASLRALGCRYAQGFLYSPAISAQHVPKLVRAWAARASQAAA